MSGVNIDIAIDIKPAPGGMELSVRLSTDKGEVSASKTYAPLEVVEVVAAMCSCAGLPAPWRS